MKVTERVALGVQMVEMGKALKIAVRKFEENNNFPVKVIQKAVDRYEIYERLGKITQKETKKWWGLSKHVTSEFKSFVGKKLLSFDIFDSNECIDLIQINVYDEICDAGLLQYVLAKSTFEEVNQRLRLHSGEPLSILVIRHYLHENEKGDSEVEE